jgi:predicted aspartyl protease
MAITFLLVRVSNPASPETPKEYEFLVDSGALYSVMPANVLGDLGIVPTSSEQFILANGEVITKPVGNALFEYKGKLRAAPVIFGENDIYLLGATTIEALGMVLDPIRRELKPLPMVLMQVEHIEMSRRFSAAVTGPMIELCHRWPRQC